MRYLTDANQSTSRVLAEAHRSLRMGIDVSIDINGAISPAQLGALLSLSKQPGVKLEGKILSRIGESHWQGDAGINSGKGSSSLEDLIVWLDESVEIEAAQINIGFWLSNFFLVERRTSVATELTRLLVGKKLASPELGVRRLVRRYPTGGISEKQALILPALLQSISQDVPVASLFLIAGLLAHTGGTRAKLSIMQGFQTVSSAEIESLELGSDPVRYVSADDSVCPRDAILYKMRGETGTVEDYDLMVSSIMSKQIAVPSDAIVIDVLFGHHSFLKDFNEARFFGSSCLRVADEFDIKLECRYRADNSYLPKSIGASTEVLEAYEILQGLTCAIEDSEWVSELSVALQFIEAMALAVGISPEKSKKCALGRLKTGAAAESFIKLMQIHGVSHEWLEKLIANPRECLLGHLHAWTLYSEKDGIVSIDFIRLADAVNSEINHSRAEGRYGFEVLQGGVNLLCHNETFVGQSYALLEAFSEFPLSERAKASIRSAFTISSPLA